MAAEQGAEPAGAAGTVGAERAVNSAEAAVATVAAIAAIGTVAAETSGTAGARGPRRTRRSCSSSDSAHVAGTDQHRLPPLVHLGDVLDDPVVLGCSGDVERLDHPQKHPRPHRMATTTPPRPRPTPHQHLPPPREAATPQRRGQPRRSVRIAAREDLWTSPHRRASSPPGQHPPEPASWPLRRSCDQTPSPSSFLGPPHPSRYSARVLPSQRRKPANRPSIRDGRPAMRSARPNW